MSCSGICLVICFRTNSLVNLVHSVVDYLATSKKSLPSAEVENGAPWRCLGSARGVHATKFAGFKKVKVESALSDDFVTITQGPLDCINDTECLEEIASELQMVFEFFRLCECC
jgi:hypothetical protein